MKSHSRKRKRRKLPMGLDVYLCRYEIPLEDVEARQEHYSNASDKIYEEESSGKPYKEMSDDEKELARKRCDALKEEMQLDQYGCIPHEKIEIPSAKHPDHLCKIGYLRSSYNCGGFNHVVGNLVGMTLYDIFPKANNQEYMFVMTKEEWEEAKARAEEVLEKLQTSPAFFCEEVVLNPFSLKDEEYGAKTPEQAIEMTRDERSRFDENNKDKAEDDPFKMNNYSNRNGTFFFGSPLKVVATIPGYSRFGKTPCAYVVYEAEEGLKWYIQMAEIVVEFCQYGIEHPEVVFHWSA